MKLQESASLVVDQYVGTVAPSDLLIHETLVGWLFENRIQKLIAHTPEVDSSHDTHAEHRTPKAIITHLTQRFDPTEGKVHTEHLLKWYQGGHFRQEDHEHIRGLLKRYEKNKGSLPFKPQDFDSPDNLRLSLDHHLGGTHTVDFAKSMSPEDRDAVEKGSELVHNDEHFEIRKLRSKAHHLAPSEAAKADPHSHKAMEILGSNTAWCTSREGSTRFEDYSKSGPLYWIYSKKDNSRHVFLEGDKQFVDEYNVNRYGKFDSRGELHPRFRPIEHLLHKFNYTKEKEVKNPTPEQQEEFLNSDSMRLMLATAHKMSSEDIHKNLVLKPHPSVPVRSILAKSKNVHPKTIHHALLTNQDPSIEVLKELADNKNIERGTIEQALNDPRIINSTPQDDSDEYESLHNTLLFSLGRILREKKPAT